jgi:tetratricopeptide (TPR) repeat protein
MKKLAFICALQHNLEESLSIYEKVLKKKKDDVEVLNMICDITFELNQYDRALKYVKIVLKDKPRNVDRLLMEAVCFENLEEFSEAFDVYKRIVELQPYNTLARNKLNELFTFKK